MVISSALAKLAQLVTNDRGAVAQAREAVTAAGVERRRRDHLAPGARPDGPGQWLEPMTESECWDLLAEQPFGRLAYTAHSGVPVIVPVNFAVIQAGVIAIWSGRGPKLAAAQRRDMVALEIDSIDVERRTGWSVVTSGRARLAEPSELRLALASGLRPWAAGPREDVIVVDVAHVAGRRLHDST